MTRPTDTLLAALERRRHAQARHAHPYPQLIPHPDRAGE